MEPKKLKVLIGITKSNFGGAQRYVFDLATRVRSEEIETAVLCGGNGTLVDKLKLANVVTITLPSLERDISFIKDLRSFIDIYTILKNTKPDVFHINSSKMGGVGALAARLARVPKIIFTAHGFEFNGPVSKTKAAFYKIFVWLTLLLSHEVIYVSAKTQKEVSSWFFINNKGVVTRNGVDNFPMLDMVNARTTLLSHVHPKTLIIGTVVELRKIKGVDILIKSFAQFIKNHKAELVILGNGEEKENLENLASDLNISSHVHFKGFVDDARNLLKGFDIFVLPSRSEAMPYAPLEAGHASVPVIATRVGGVPEIILDETLGTLVENENIHEMSEALIELADDENLRRSKGEALHKKVLANFSIESMVRDTIQIYVQTNA